MEDIACNMIIAVMMNYRSHHKMVDLRGETIFVVCVTGYLVVSRSQCA